MGLNDRIDDARNTRGQKHRRLSRKQAALADARNHRGAVGRHIQTLERERDEARKAENEERVKAISAKLQRARDELQATNASIERLERIIPSLKDSIRRLTAAIKRWVREIQSEPQIVVAAGSPHWGGAEDILKLEVVPVAERMGRYITSGKRSETFGNPSSDHYVGNTTASARDFQPGVDLAIAIAKQLGIGYYGYGQDYQSFYISRAGRTFRVQIIASNHGTGPHVHVGVKLA